MEMWRCAHHYDVSHGETTWAHEACHQKGVVKQHTTILSTLSDLLFYHKLFRAVFSHHFSHTPSQHLSPHISHLSPPRPRPVSLPFPPLGIGGNGW